MKTVGQIAYEAYCQSSGGKSLISGAVLPVWEDLKPEITEAWEKAGEAVYNYTVNELNNFTD